MPREYLVGIYVYQIMTRSFHLGDILSITTERFVSPTGMCGIRKLLEFMTGTHDMTDSGAIFCRPRCAEALLSQHPALAAVVDDETIAVLPPGWLDAQVARFGERLLVAPLPEAAR